MISVVRGALTDQPVEVIVNAANTRMRGGGGIDGRIHHLAGRGMLEELRRVAPSGAEVAEPVVTSGHDLPHRYVIHIAGPVWREIGDEPDLLEATYRNAYLKAVELGVESIGFCSISTGAFGFPLELGGEIAVQTISALVTEQPLKVVFAMYGLEEFEVFRQLLSARGSENS
ncbi:MAG: macro domain-containing protein [Armatimonadota bacterium]